MTALATLLDEVRLQGHVRLDGPRNEGAFYTLYSNGAATYRPVEGEGISICHSGGQEGILTLAAAICAGIPVRHMPRGFTLPHHVDVLERCEQEAHGETLTFAQQDEVEQAVAADVPDPADYAIRAAVVPTAAPARHFGRMVIHTTDGSIIEADVTAITITRGVIASDYELPF